MLILTVFCSIFIVAVLTSNLYKQAKLYKFDSNYYVSDWSWPNIQELILSISS